MAREQEATVVGIFWDYENCSPSQYSNGFEIVSSIRKIAAKHGPIKQFRAYKDADLHPNSGALRADLQSSGVSMIDCPHNNMKDVVDKMLIVDVMAFSREYPTATIILIAGDRDYAYMISYLRNCLHYVTVITPGPRYLGSHASEMLEWKSIVPPRPRPAPFIPPNGHQFFSYDSNLPQFQMPHSNFIPPPPPPPPPPPHTQSEGLIRHQSLHPIPNSDNSFIHMNSFYRPPESNAVVMKVDESDRAIHPEPTPELAFVVNDSNLEHEPVEVDDFQLALSIPLPSSSDISSCASSPYIPIRDVVDEASESVQSPKLVEKAVSTEDDKAANNTQSPPPRPTTGSFVSFALDKERVNDLFGPLIRCLLQLDAQGTVHPLRSVVNEALIKQKPSPYQKCKASNWSEYSKMAEAAGVIILGTDPTLQGRDWIELKPAFKSSNWKAKLKVSAEVSEKPRIQSAFKPLLLFLDTNYREGKTKLLRSMACEHLLRHHKGLFDKHGYHNWRDYAAAAESAGYIKLTGGQQGGGDNFISLASKWRGQI